jgi:4,5-dihydroxyphthalate decarboxylase
MTTGRMPGKSRDTHLITRRKWMSTAGAGTMLAFAPVKLRAAEKLQLTLACWDYDRTRPLMDGRVQVDGADLTYLNLPVEETFFRMLRNAEFDASEMSLSSYVVSLFEDHPRFIAIPIFPSRFFRHSCVYVNAASGIREPKDLIGKKVGTPEYQMTAPVWIRGILSDEYKVPVASVTYYTGGEEEAGRGEKLPLSLPPAIRIMPIGPTQTLSKMLETGEIDALHTARAPSSFTSGSGNVRRLFPDYAEVERAYYQKTKIFPIMHTVVIRRDVYEKHPWVAQSLHKAFMQAQKIAYSDLHETAALKAMLPWLLPHVEETEKLMGRDFWQYGYDTNVNTLSTFLRYSHEQGLSKRLLAPKDLFAKESIEAFKV